MESETATAPAPEVGLLATAEIKSVLRQALGGAATEAQLDAAVARLWAAEFQKWEQLPPEVDPEMGYNFRFLSCGVDPLARPPGSARWRHVPCVRAARATL